MDGMQRRHRIILLTALPLVALVVAGSVLVARLERGDARHRPKDAAGLQFAVDNAASGAVIEVPSGQFGTLRIHDRSWQRPITIEGTHDHLSFLEAIDITGSSGVTLRNLNISDRVTASGSGNLRIEGSRVGHGVALRDGVHDAAIRGNRIDGGKFGVWIYAAPGRARNHGISIEGNDISGQTADNIQAGNVDDLRVVDNRIHDIADNPDHNDGVQFMGGRGLVISGNRFWAQDEGIMLKAEPVLGTGTTVAGAVVENNVVHSERGAGMIFAGTDGTSVANNTGTGNGFADIHVEAANPGLRIWNNVVQQIYKGGTTPIPLEDGNCVEKTTDPGPNDLLSRPRFADDDTYRLAAGSCDADRLRRGKPPDAPTTSSAPPPANVLAGAWLSASP